MIERTYRVNDVIKSEFLRLPLTLLANPKYKAMSLEAKFIYSLLLNRMTLSQRNDWINEDNEVYLIYTREEAASTLNISYKRSIAAFKELIRNGLLYEQRQGLGAPNLLYVLKAELTDEDAAAFGETFSGNESETDAKEPETPANTQMCQNGISRHAETAHQDMPNLSICKQIPVRGLCLRLRRTDRPRMKRSYRKFLTNASWSCSRTVCGECWCRRSNGCIIPTASGSAAQDCRRKRCAVI